MRSPSDTLIRFIIITPELLVDLSLWRSTEKRIPQMEFYFPPTTTTNRVHIKTVMLLVNGIKLSIKPKINMLRKKY